MKITSENAKIYLKYAHQVLGISHIFRATNKAAEIKDSDSNKKKIFNVYFWSETRAWLEFQFENPASPAPRSFQTLFVFFNANTDFETQLQNQTEMLSKMNQALGGVDRDLLLVWLSANAERDFFEYLESLASPLKVVLFREESVAKDSMYSSGPHKILETLSPMVDPNDVSRKRHVWNDFKRWMASLSG